MSGVVESLTTDWRGATLLAAVGSVLTVDDVADFDEEGGWLTVADAAPVEYVAVDDDAATVTLAGAAGTVEAGDPVSIWDPSVPPSGAKVVEYLASVMTDRGPVDAVVEHEAIPFAGVDTLVGASVTLEEDAYGNPYVGRVLGREPVQDLSFADASTLDVSSLPPVPTTDGDAPDNATTVTPIGGIGSMFYRWTEVTNNDPVTYRLHVRAGSAPATDGTYEVAAGVGLTSAAVRKLKDGTAIVGDGTVTYHAIVTVEDADGPGPASADVTGVPAQVNSGDLALNALTAAHLTTNDLLADTIDGTTITGVTITGPLIRTVASGRRVQLSSADNWLAFYSGSGSEKLPGYMEADVVGNFARLVIAAPDTDETLKSQVSYRNMILMQEDVTDATATRVSRVISLRTGHFFIETAGGALIHVDGSGSDPDIDLDSAFLRNFTAGDGAVGAGTFRDSVDARVTAVAPTATMTTGGVGTGAFRDSVRAAIQADYAAGAWTAYTPTFTASVTNPTLGNFTISGRYNQVGKTVNFVALFTCNTAANMGSGNYQFGLPVAARATNEIVCIAQQSGPNHGYQGRGASTTTVNLFLTSTDAVATVTSTGMAAATSIRITGTYEAA